jgi:Extensin-like protein C-terminus
MRDVVDSVRTAACGWYTIVLGPGSEAARTDHLHADIAMQEQAIGIAYVNDVVGPAAKAVRQASNGESGEAIVRIVHALHIF